MDNVVKIVLRRAKAIHFCNELPKSELLCVTSFFEALRSLSEISEIQSALETIVGGSATEWPSVIRKFYENQLGEIIDQEEEAEQQKLQLDVYLKNAFQAAKKTQGEHINLKAWLKELVRLRESEIVDEFVKINGTNLSLQVSLVEQFSKLKVNANTLRDSLAENLVGQNAAVDMLCHAYWQSKVYAGKSNGPLGIITLVGPSGVCKEAVARTFADGLSAVEEEVHLFFKNIKGLEPTASPHVIFIDQIEKFDAKDNVQRLFSWDVKNGVIGDHDLSNAWLIIGTSLGEDFFDESNASGVFNALADKRAAAFEILKNSVTRVFGEDASAIDNELFELLRAESLVILDKLSAPDYCAIIDDEFEQAGKQNKLGIPKIEISDDAKMAMILSQIPSLDESGLRASVRHFVSTHLGTNLVEFCENNGVTASQICISANSETQNYVRNRLVGGALQIFLLDDDPRMEDFIHTNFSGYDLELKRGEGLKDVGSFSPDLIMLDLDLHQTQSQAAGLSLHARLIEMAPDVPIFLFSETKNRLENLRQIVRQGGARGFFFFESGAQSIETIVEGDKDKEKFAELLDSFRLDHFLAQQVKCRRTLSYSVSYEESNNSGIMQVAIVDPCEEKVIDHNRENRVGSLSEIPTASFDDIYGLSHAKKRLKLVVDMMAKPRALATMDLVPPTGFLLAGAPGTGKTFLARAFAGETKMPFFQLSAGELESKWAGESEERIRKLFTDAKKHAPSVIFIDEIDSIASARESMGGGESSHGVKALNQLLTCMDGFKRDDHHVFVLAATNRPDALDPAIRRPGRFDEIIYCGLPDAKTRKALILHKFPEVFQGDADAPDLARVVARTGGFSPAEIDRVAREAGYLAIARNDESRTFEDIDTACRLVKFGAENREMELEESDRIRTAWHEAGHAIARHYLCPSQTIDLISIIPTEDGALGFVATNINEKQYTISANDVLNELIVCLSGREAEKKAPGLNSEEAINSGASSDIDKATRIALKSITEFGLDDEFGMVSLKGIPNDLKSELGETVHNRVKVLIEKAADRTRDFLNEHKVQLELVAKELVRSDSLDGAKFLELLNTNYSKLKDGPQPKQNSPEPESVQIT